MKSHRPILGILLALALVLAGCSSHHALVTTVTQTQTLTTTTTAVPSTAEPGLANAHRPDDFGNAPPGLKLKAIAPSKSSTPTVEQFDDVTVSLLPKTSKYIGAYANGRFVNTSSVRTAFPKATIKSISVTADAPAQCVDIEPGDATPSEAPVFYRIARQAGVAKPCFYFPLTLSGQVNASLAAANIARSSVYEWDAHWTGVPHIDEGFDGTQWTDHALGRSLDESTLTAKFAGALIKPVDARHWDWLPNTRHTFTVGSHKVSARERSAVRGWDKAGCVNPVKRPGCVEYREHLGLLAGRVFHIATHSADGKRLVLKPRWTATHFKAADGHVTTLGGAYFQLSRRERTDKPVTSWVPK